MKSLTDSILDRIVATKRDEVRHAVPRLDEYRHIARQAPEPRGFAAALRRPGEVRLLAEVKRRSPSAGDIRPGADPVEIARAYVGGGAAALSVLTDREYFGGDLDFLRAVRAEVPVPVIRKDFLIHPVQVWEARAAGADAVLLIVRILEQPLLRELHALAADLGMDVLVEAHTEAELDRALEAGATLVGVNNRDLDTFATDLDLCVRLADRVPAEVTYVGESGIRTPTDVDRLGAAGIDAILVGESLMRQPDVRAAAAALVNRPKSGARGG
ncbi:MAG TPA: indole-3-glycerol phosphate synthase TrpC [Longimicrobium sp.]